MPIEAISCPKCGSSDATEFKRDTYACGNCETVFKHVVVAPMGIATPNCHCGTFAIGNCADCLAAVCELHGGRWVDGTFLCGADWRRRTEDETRGGAGSTVQLIATVRSRLVHDEPRSDDGYISSDESTSTASALRGQFEEFDRRFLEDHGSE